MRIRAAVSAALASAGILTAGWQSGAHVAEHGATVASDAYLTSLQAALDAANLWPSPAESPAQSGPALKSRTFQCMGTVISLALPAGAARGGGEVLEGATAAVERVFAGLDATFSLYRPDSAASRLARGEVTLRDASAAFRARYADAASGG